MTASNQYNFDDLLLEVLLDSRECCLEINSVLLDGRETNRYRCKQDRLFSEISEASNGNLYAAKSRENVEQLEFDYIRQI